MGKTKKYFYTVSTVVPKSAYVELFEETELRKTSMSQLIRQIIGDWSTSKRKADQEQEEA